MGLAVSPGKRAAYVSVATVAMALNGAREARADRAEASLHAHAVGGVALVADPATSDTATSPLAGIAVRASYATSNLFQYDAQLTLASTGAASFEGGTFEFAGESTTAVPFDVTTRLLRFDAGVTFRFGVQLIPTIRIAIGVDERLRGPVRATIAGLEQEPDGRGGDNATDLVGVGALGLDYRFGPRLVAGASIGGSAAVPLGGPSWRTIEASAHVAYYFYPLWFE